MAFGFDHSIILHQPRDTTDPDRALQSGMTLGSLMRQRQRENTLADIYRASAFNPQGLSSALMGGGFGAEAYAAQDQQAQLAARDSENRARVAETMRKRLELLARPLRGGLKSQEDLDRVWATWESSGFDPRELNGIPRVLNEQTAPTFERIGSFGMSAHEAQQAAHQGATLKETNRHNLEMEKRPVAGMMPMPVLVSGEGGVQQVIDLRSPTKPAVTPTDAAGKPIVKPPAKTQKSLTEASRRHLQEYSDGARIGGDLLASFKDQFAGKGVTGGAEVALAQKLASHGSPEQQELATFWADFAKFIDLPDRNKTFGASLSSGEKQSWESAKNIRPGMDPKIVRERIQKIVDIANLHSSKLGRSLVKEGFDPEAIEEYTGPLSADAAPAPAPAPAPVNAGTSDIVMMLPPPTKANPHPKPRAVPRTKVDAALQAGGKLVNP